MEITISPFIPPQHKYLGGPKGDPPKWNGIVLDASATALRRQWVAKHIGKILEAARDFIDNNIKSQRSKQKGIKVRAHNDKLKTKETIRQ